MENFPSKIIQVDDLRQKKKKKKLGEYSTLSNCV